MSKNRGTAYVVTLMVVVTPEDHAGNSITATEAGEMLEQNTPDTETVTLTLKSSLRDLADEMERQFAVDSNVDATVEASILGVARPRIPTGA